MFMLCFYSWRFLLVNTERLSCLCRFAELANYLVSLILLLCFASTLNHRAPRSSVGFVSCCCCQHERLLVPFPRATPR